MNNKTIKLKIAGVPDNYQSIPLGRQMEFGAKINSFKAGAKKEYLSIKRCAAGPAIKRFLKATGAKEYYMSYFDGPNVRDDSIEIFYTIKPCPHCGNKQLDKQPNGELCCLECHWQE